MRILIVSNHDHANFAHDTANALRAAGSNCDDVKLHPHKYGYKSQSTVMRDEQIQRMVSKYDIVMVMHSDPFIFHFVKKGNPKRLAVWHTGSLYRQNPKKFNDLFNPFVDVSFIALGEFSGLGAKNEVYSVGAIDTHRIKPLKEEISSPVKIYHLPSNPGVKGTDKILEMINEIDQEFDFYYMTENREYEEQLEYMQDSDIYIELFAPTQTGKPYGSWGITALEAAAMGKAVITQQFTVEVYEKTYGCPPGLVLAHSEDEFKQKISSLIESPSLLKTRQENARKWVEQFHSMEATGKNILKNICI